MRFVVSSMLVVICAAPSSAAAQASGAAAGKPAISACALLTREMVSKFATLDKSVIFLVPPQEDAIGTHGSACEYGGIGLQIDPFVRSETLRKSPGKDWQAVPGVGDTAFFRDNRGLFAELMVWTGNHHFTIQMSVPMGGKAESIKPNTIGLANALIPKLR